MADNYTVIDYAASTTGNTTIAALMQAGHIYSSADNKTYKARRRGDRRHQRRHHVRRHQRAPELHDRFIPDVLPTERQCV